MELLPANHDFPLCQFIRILDHAVIIGQLSAVELVFEKAGTMLNPENCWHLLNSAAVSDQLEVARFFVNKGIDAYTVQKMGENPMHTVAFSGNLAMARLLLQAGITVTREVSRTGRTSVHYAAAAGNVDMVELLIRAGADILSTDMHKRTVLFNAAIAGIDDASSTKTKESRITIPKPSAESAEVMKLLLWYGADPFPRDIRGMTVLHAICEKGYIEQLQALLSFAVDTSVRDMSGLTPLHYAIYGGHQKVFEMLIAAGADIHARDDKGRNLLHTAAIVSNGDMVKLLLEKGISHTIQDNDGWTALHHAVYNGNPNEDDAFDSAFDHLYNASNRTFYQPGRYRKPMTAHRAAEIDSVLEGTDLLYAAGVDFYARINGLSALDIAIEQGREAMVETLLETYTLNPNHLPTLDHPDDAGPNFPFPPLHRACTLGHTSIVGLLLSAGADPNLRDTEGQTALHNAALENHHQIIPLLMSHRANPNPTDTEQRTPLHHACELGYLPTVQLLLKYLPPPKKPIPKGRLVRPSDPDFADYDLSINMPDKDGNTALHIAVLNDRHELIEPLLDAGADPRRRDAAGMTALGLARGKKLHRIKNILSRRLGKEAVEEEEREEEKESRRKEEARRTREDAGPWFWGWDGGGDYGNFFGDGHYGIV